MRYSFRASLALVVLVASAAPASAMTMQVSGDQITLSGQVVASDGPQFRGLLDANPGITTVVLRNSPGGSAVANRAISQMIAEHKLATAVAGYCVSACAMIFLSGTKRTFSDGEPIEITSLGYHGNYLKGMLNQEPRLAALKATVLEETGGKADPALVERWTHFASEHETMRFRYPGPDAKTTTTTVFHCSNAQPNRGNYATCEAIPGVNALTMGIITSTEIVHVQK